MTRGFPRLEIVTGVPLATISSQIPQKWVFASKIPTDFMISTKHLYACLLRLGDECGGKEVRKLRNLPQV